MEATDRWIIFRLAKRYQKMIQNQNILHSYSPRIPLLSLTKKVEPMQMMRMI